MADAPIKSIDLFDIFKEEIGLNDVFAKAIDKGFTEVNTGHYKKTLDNNQVIGFFQEDESDDYKCYIKQDDNTKGKAIDLSADKLINKLERL